MSVTRRRLRNAATGGAQATLRSRLADAEETLRAIRSGEVDALVVNTSEGDRVFTLRGADEPYRILLEQMSEGAASLSGERIVLYANRRLAEILGMPLSALIGSNFDQLVPSSQRGTLDAMLDPSNEERHRSGEFSLLVGGGHEVEVHASSARLPPSAAATWSIIMTDVTERAHRLAAIVDSTTDAVIRLGADGTIETWNPGAETLYGYRAEEVLGQNAATLLAKDPTERAALIEAVADRGATIGFQGDDVRHDGTSVSVAITDSPIHDPSGKMVGIARIARDVTERKVAEAERARLAAIVASSPDAIASVGLDGTILAWNRAAEETFGFTAEEAIGACGPTLLGFDQKQSEALLSTGASEVLRDIDVWFTAKSGAEVALSGSSAPIIESGEPVGVSVILRDVTERSAIERSEHEARELLSAITESMAEGMLALDAEGRLIYMNRSAQSILGWTEDELRGRQIDETIHHQCHDGRPLHRSPHGTAIAGAAGERVRIDDDTFIHRDGHTVAVSCSCSPFEGESSRGTVVVFSDVTELRAEQERRAQEQNILVWVGRVRDALDENRFVLHAQPIVDLRSGEPVQHELLIRMRDRRATGSLISPGTFLPAAERYGLIGEIDEWVTDQAASLAARGHAIEFNLSAASLARPELADSIFRAFREAGADPANVVCEITETAVLQNEHAARTFATRLTALGFGLALDDFGTGYGGFTYLTMFPVTHIKIDRSFITHLREEPANRHVVAAVVTLAAGFGRKTVAEGVEDEETAELLRSMGVDYGQGYYFGRPAPLAEVLGE